MQDNSVLLRLCAITRVEGVIYFPTSFQATAHVGASITSIGCIPCIPTAILVKSVEGLTKISFASIILLESSTTKLILQTEALLLFTVSKSIAIILV